MSDFLVVVVKTNPSAKGVNGISLLIMDRASEGLSATKLDKLGWRASDTGEIAFDNVKVPVENLLGDENKGFFYIMQHFVSERLSMAVGGYAASEYALELTIKYLDAVSYTHLRAHETLRYLVCRLLLEKKN